MYTTLDFIVLTKSKSVKAMLLTPPYYTAISPLKSPPISLSHLDALDFPTITHISTAYLRTRRPPPPCSYAKSCPALTLSTTAANFCAKDMRWKDTFDAVYVSTDDAMWYGTARQDNSPGGVRVVVCYA
ncbi:hypothetical protein PTRG_07174 [Pyrenophora tritici-repentis Pt-1C-BFP]|uniref:Uncharacterized protein n=1 Tax=Pyrenophora tritici-repentis (strain Pt-1C-BFP) TaxID=426418 RepID=B2WA61_PYRTR|nr:uncharacterized protein PTRG_07174 [Pyrenophora tritici-repentis Pt-1C-BFP]EDU50093.1 hypothetical protein PTRG_07174 [Pyrenophora tritici-repentis Pt-1C-BFP]